MKLRRIDGSEGEKTMLKSPNLLFFEDRKWKYQKREHVINDVEVRTPVFWCTENK